MSPRSRYLVALVFLVSAVLAFFAGRRVRAPVSVLRGGIPVHMPRARAPAPPTPLVASPTDGSAGPPVAPLHDAGPATPRPDGAAARAF